MSEPHQQVVDALYSVTGSLLNLSVAGFTVVVWAFNKLPSIAAAVSIAFIVWQWHRMVKKDRLEAQAKEKQHAPEIDPAN